MKNNSQKKLNLPKFAIPSIVAFVAILVVYVVLLIVLPAPRPLFLSIILNVYIIGSMLGLFVVVLNLTTKRNKAENDAILQEATTDEIAGTATFQKLNHEFKELPDNAEGWAIAFVAINGYDTFLDVFGYKTSSAIIKNAGLTFGNLCGGVGVIAYLNTGRFAILFHSDEDKQKSVDELTELIEKFDASQMFSQSNYKCTCSSGLYFFDGSEIDIDYALSLLKINTPLGNKNFCFDFTSVINKNAEMTQELTKDINSAIKNKEFKAVFQPKCSFLSDRIIGAETFARWEHPTKGIIMPGDFIPILENNGLVSKLDLMMVEEACKLVKQWIDRKIPPVPISVNISKHTAEMHNFAESLTAILQTYQVPASLIELELSHTALYEKPEVFIKVASKLADIEYSLVLDNFGLEKYTIELLQKVEMQVIKLEKYFFFDASKSERGQTILTNTIKFLRDLDIVVIAKNVETQEEADALKKCGCEYAQGYFFSKPVSEDKFLEMFKDGNEKAPVAPPEPEPVVEVAAEVEATETQENVAEGIVEGTTAENVATETEPEKSEETANV